MDVLYPEVDLPKGHVDVSRQLDALAHVIAKDDIKKVAARWGITRNGVYQLARSALKRLRGARPSPRRRARQGASRRAMQHRAA